MINVNAYPKPLLLAGNKVLLKCTGNKMYIDPGRVSNFLMSFTPTSAVANGTQFKLAWGTKSVTIYFKTTPDNSGFQFKATTSLDASWVALFAAFLKNIYDLETDFAITYTTSPSLNIWLQSRVKSADYSIVITGTPPYQYSTNVSGVLPVIRPGYQHVFQVKDANNVLIGEEAITPDEYQKSTFDLSEYLWNKLELNRSLNTGFTFPSVATKIIEHSSHALSFFVKYAEKYDLQVQGMTTGAICAALMGGLSKLKEQEFADYGTSFDEMLSDDKFFLTWQPVTKRTCLNAPERIYFYNDTTRTIYLKANVYFTDATTAITAVDDFSAIAGRIYEVDVSPGIFAGSAKQIEKIEWWLENGSAALISEIRTYLIDYTFYRNEQYFIFRNSLGEYDTVRCTGRLRRQSELDRDIFTNDDNERQQLSNLLDATYLAETGSIPGDHARWLEDLMLSKEVYWLINQRAVPIIITSKKMNEITDDQRRFNLQFEFSVAGIDSFYSTPKAKPVDFGVIGNNNNNTIIDA